MHLARGAQFTLYKPAVRWFIIALCVRLVVGGLIHLYSIEAGFEGFLPLAAGSDDPGYFSMANYIAEGRAHQIPAIPTSYPYFVAALFYVFGPSLIIGKLANVFAGALTVYFGVLLARRLHKDDDQSVQELSHPVNIAGLALTFYPSSLFYSTQLTKDALLCLFGIMTLFVFVRALQLRSGLSWLWLLVPVVGLADLRGYALLAIMAGIGLWIFIQPGLIRRNMVALAALSIIAIPVVLILIPHYIGLLNLDELAKFRTASYTGGSSVGITLDFSNPVSFVVSYAYNFLTVLAGPFPWQIQEPQHLIALFEAIPMYFLLPVVALRFITTLLPRDPRDKLLFIVSMTQLGAFALLSDNIGTNARLRILAWSCLAIHFALTYPLMMRNIAAFFARRKSKLTAGVPSDPGAALPASHH
jgi:hypothetical protein